VGKEVCTSAAGFEMPKGCAKRIEHGIETVLIETCGGFKGPHHFKMRKKLKEKGREGQFEIPTKVVCSTAQLKSLRAETVHLLSEGGRVLPKKIWRIRRGRGQLQGCFEGDPRLEPYEFKRSPR